MFGSVFMMDKYRGTPPALYGEYPSLLTFMKLDFLRSAEMRTIFFE